MHSFGFYCFFIKPLICWGVKPSYLASAVWKPFGTDEFSQQEPVNTVGEAAVDNLGEAECFYQKVWLCFLLNVRVQLGHICGER